MVGGLAGTALAPKSTATTGGGGSKGTIKVVGVFPLSGAIASDGKEMEQAMGAFMQQLMRVGMDPKLSKPLDEAMKELSDAKPMK